MRLRHVLFYLLLQFLMLNLCVVVGSALYLLGPRYVTGPLLILVVPVALSFVVGHVASARFDDHSIQHNFTAANGLVGLLVAIAVGVIMHGGGIGTVRSLTLKPVAGIRPPEAPRHGDADYFELVDARILEECAHERVVTSGTTHRSHDGRSRRLSHTDTYKVAPVVATDYKYGDPIAVWITSYSRVSQSKSGWSSSSSRGVRGQSADDGVISGEVLRDRTRRASYERTARQLMRIYNLPEATGVRYIEHVPDFFARRRRRTRYALLMLAVSNVLLVLLPGIIYPFAFRSKKREQAA